MKKIAVVTGAGSGIGRAVALALFARGYGVALAGRRREALEETLALAGARADGLAITADVRDESAVEALFAGVERKFARLDLLFNNAGVFTPPTPIEDVSLAQWSDALAVNLTGCFLCAREAFRVMKRQSPQGGRIINNGSISAHVPRPHAAPYTATKHAITGLTKSLSLEGRAYNIACGQIDIGNAATEMAAGIAKGTLQADGSLSPEPTMDIAAVADGVLYMADLPLSANVQFMTVMATNMPFIGRG